MEACYNSSNGPSSKIQLEFNTVVTENVVHSSQVTIIYVSESEMFGPIDYLCNIENLVSFEKTMFENYSFKHKMKAFLFLCQYHHFRNYMPEAYIVHVKYMGDTFLSKHT